jgi:hypothetical protein
MLITREELERLEDKPSRLMECAAGNRVGAAILKRSFLSHCISRDVIASFIIPLPAS